MKKLLLLVLLVTTVSNAQIIQRIKFDYDTTGNQVERVICSNCGARISNENPKEEDFFKNEISSSIDYYPNPVKEELYLKWTNKLDANIETIELSSISGQLLKKSTEMQDKKNTSITFSEYPQGMYVLVFIYTNGERESIKIVKQ
jgi:hypothetical protein